MQRTPNNALQWDAPGIEMLAGVPSLRSAPLSAGVNAPTDALRAQLAFRIRTASPREWQEFTNLWMAFNAIYGGEPNGRERSRVMASIRRSFSERGALRVLRVVTKSIDRILAVPPGNLLLNKYDPNFRAASQRCTALYRNRRESAAGRLAAAAGVLYQIRCNLIHGDKDPDSDRDRMLVGESLAVLRVLVPAIETELASS